jgi:hypothetical protein
MTGKIIFDKEWSEYIVKFYDHTGQWLKNADYFTDCLDDANDTLSAELTRANRGNAE